MVGIKYKRPERCLGCRLTENLSNYDVQVATDAEAFVFDLPAVAHLPALSTCVAGILAAAVPLKVGVGVAEDLKLLARCARQHAVQERGHVQPQAC